MLENNQPTIDERLSRIEVAIAELATGQQQTSSLILSKLDSLETELGLVKSSVSSLETELGLVKSSVSSLETELGSVKSSVFSLGLEMTEIREDAKQRYTDFRSRTELNNDKLSLIMRELNQIAQDIRYPKFTVADTR